MIISHIKGEKVEIMHLTAKIDLLKELFANQYTIVHANQTITSYQNLIPFAEVLA